MTTLLLEWIHKPNPQRGDVVETQPLGRVEQNKDICLAICKLLKLLRTVKINANKLLFDEEDNQTHCLKLRRDKTSTKTKMIQRNR